MTNGLEYFEDQEIVFWIVRLLFEPILLDERIPVPMVAVNLIDEKSPAASNWPLNPMAVVGDIPFMLGQRIGMGGMPEHPSSHIEWARRHGVIREEPLRPKTSPVLAAETLLPSPQFKQLDTRRRAEAIQLVRLQALAMLSTTAPPVVTWHRNQKEADRQWNAHVQASERLEVHWDATRKEFVRRDN